MSTRTPRGQVPALAPVPFQDGQASLFDVDVPATDTGEAGAHECTECHRTLYSQRSIEAGVGPGCAAKTGRAVIIAARRSQRARKGQTAPAA